MHKDILYIHLTCQIYYDPIENEYSGTPGGGPLDDDDTNDGVSWDDDDVDMNQPDDNRILSSRVPSPDVEISDTWNLQLVESPDNIIAEVHCILFMYFRQ